MLSGYCSSERQRTCIIFVVTRVYYTVVLCLSARPDCCITTSLTDGPYAHHTYMYIRICTWKILIRRENNNNTKRNLECVNRGLYPHYMGTSELIDRQSREVRESSSL